MRREKALEQLYLGPGINEDVSAEYNDAVEIEALEQELCEDEYIKVPKKALKYRTAGMVAYNVKWLKNHFDMERAVICGVQQPCSDAISRSEAIKMVQKHGVGCLDADDFFPEQCERFVINRLNELPSVKPKPKNGVEEGLRLEEEKDE